MTPWEEDEDLESYFFCFQLHLPMYLLWSLGLCEIPGLELAAPFAYVVSPSLVCYVTYPHLFAFQLPKLC